MKVNKHTPGPWTADTWIYQSPDTSKFDRHVPCICSKARGMRIAALDSDEGNAGNPYTFTLNEAQANARLIAAAPELLDALSQLTREIYKLRGELGTQYPALAEAFLLASAAIAKATEADANLESEVA